MKNFLLFLCCILLMTSRISQADAPPRWEPFLVHSSSNQWSAYIYSDKRSQEPWKDKWQLQIFNKYLSEYPDTDDVPFWSINIQYYGDSLGLLSDDGQVYVQLGYWYQHRYPLITVYRQDCRREYYADLLILPKNMPVAGSRQIWLDQNAKPQLIKNQDSLDLKVFTLSGVRTLSTVCEEK